jgi:hypothetical protein
VCGACEFSDKIRAIFERANHEFVWVSHDYVIPLPSFYAGMRSFGRGADWLVPGVFQDFRGREYDENVLRGRLFTSMAPEHSILISTSDEQDIAPISACTNSHSQSFCRLHGDGDANDEVAWHAPSYTAVLRSIVDQGNCDGDGDDNDVVKVAVGRMRCWLWRWWWWWWWRW